MAFDLSIIITYFKKKTNQYANWNEAVKEKSTKEVKKVKVILRCQKMESLKKRGLQELEKCKLQKHY